MLVLIRLSTSWVAAQLIGIAPETFFSLDGTGSRGSHAAFIVNFVKTFYVAHAKARAEAEIQVRRETPWPGSGSRADEPVVGSSRTNRPEGDRTNLNSSRCRDRRSSRSIRKPQETPWWRRSSAMEELGLIPLLAGRSGK